MNRIGAYRKERVLARGRLSTVWFARDQRNGRAVAMKLARGASFAREFELADALTGEGTIRVFEHGQAGEGGWLAMEYAPGGATSALGSPLEPGRVHALAREAACALGRLHDSGWVHRDVKPANLLLRADGTLALADLGSACRHGEGAHAAALVVGTPRYCAPEQANGAAAAPAADMYSLGVVLYEWLTGRPPFPGETLAEVRAQHLLAPVPRLPASLASWQPLVDALLAKHPAERIAEGRAFAKLLPVLQPPAANNPWTRT